MTLDELRALGAIRTGRCRFCGDPFHEHASYLLGFTAAGRPAAACLRCDHRLARTLLVGGPAGGLGETANRETRGAPDILTEGGFVYELAGALGEVEP